VMRPLMCLIIAGLFAGILFTRAKSLEMKMLKQS
jgi:hypothetical protein